MAIIISIASGKGGVGKSIIAGNLAAVLARAGKKVVLADFDVGGANQHILFGYLKPEKSLTDFIKRRVNTLEEALLPTSVSQNLRLLVGTGETLATANPTYATKKRLMKNLRSVDCEFIIVDVGAGSGYHALDFFLMADHHLVVTTPDPTAIFDAYKFIKLAAIRRVLAHFIKTSKLGSELAQGDFSSIEELMELTYDADDDVQEAAQDALMSFMPLLVVNRVSAQSPKVNILHLRKILKQYVGSELRLLAEIPADPEVEKAVSKFLPVCERTPQSPAAKALRGMAQGLVERMMGKEAA